MAAAGSLGGGLQALEVEPAAEGNPAAQDDTATLQAVLAGMDEDGDIQYVPQDAVVLIEHPDGTTEVGVESGKMPPKPHQPGRRPQQTAMERNADLEMAAALEAMLQQQAEIYGKTTMRQRRIAFYVFLVADIIYFAIAFILTIKRRGGLGNAKGSRGFSVGHHPLSVWLQLSELTTEEIMVAGVIDLIGIPAGLRENAAIMYFFIILDFVSSVLINLQGFSLFVIFRIGMLTAAYLLRNAQLKYQTLAAPPAERRRLADATFSGFTHFAATMLGFFKLLLGCDSAVVSSPAAAAAYAAPGTAAVNATATEPAAGRTPRRSGTGGGTGPTSSVPPRRSNTGGVSLAPPRRSESGAYRPSNSVGVGSGQLPNRRSDNGGVLAAAGAAVPRRSGNGSVVPAPPSHVTGNGSAPPSRFSNNGAGVGLAIAPFEFYLPAAAPPPLSASQQHLAQLQERGLHGGSGGGVNVFAPGMVAGTTGASTPYGTSGASSRETTQRGASSGTAPRQGVMGAVSRFLRPGSTNGSRGGGTAEAPRAQPQPGAGGGAVHVADVSSHMMMTGSGLYGGGTQQQQPYYYGYPLQGQQQQHLHPGAAYAAGAEGGLDVDPRILTAAIQAALREAALLREMAQGRTSLAGRAPVGGGDPLSLPSQEPSPAAEAAAAVPPARQPPTQAAAVVEPQRWQQQQQHEAPPRPSPRKEAGLPWLSGACEGPPSPSQELNPAFDVLHRRRETGLGGDAEGSSSRAASRHQSPIQRPHQHRHQEQPNSSPTATATATTAAGAAVPAGQHNSANVVARQENNPKPSGGPSSVQARQVEKLLLEVQLLRQQHQPAHTTAGATRLSSAAPSPGPGSAGGAAGTSGGAAAAAGVRSTQALELASPGRLRACSGSGRYRAASAEELLMQLSPERK